MKLLLVAVIISMLSACGIPEGASGNDAGQQSQTPTTGSGGNGGGGY